MRAIVLSEKEFEKLLSQDKAVLVETPGEEWIKADEAMRILDCSRGWLIKLANEKKIISRKISHKSVRYLKESILDYLNPKTHKHNRTK